MGGHGVLMTSVAARSDAERIARALLSERLAACVQVLPIDSFYVWQGESRNDAELLLLIKTRTALFEPAIARIKALHPYEVPEITTQTFTTGSAAYFSWIDEVTA